MKKPDKKLPKIKTMAEIEKEYPICGTAKLWMKKLAKDKKAK
ncbi:Uncharacterised protein [Candidatus Bilamarchaeum dharawalense]|uniref:Uncharacterized protein n=1 Tax=Candidatus Bilamarchaeum dharawalense TaxID=2885759 RepID=A0A5E4LKF2_9ARCH|nr:Uncharacterised protein [Candidatus Bilamarchaeum dharawalense]